MVKVRLVDPFSGIDAAPNALMITGGAATVMVATLLVLGPCVVVAVKVLFLMPTEVPCTLTVTVHDPLAGTVPPDKLSWPAPATAVGVPPQVFVNAGVESTTMPAGKKSVNARDPIANAVVLMNVAVSVVVPSNGMVAAPKNFAMPGGASTTSMLAEAVLPAPPSVEMTAPVVLISVPTVVPVTFSEKEHEPPAAAIVAVASEMVLLPAAAATTPPAHPAPTVSPLGVETTSPAGKKSVNAAPVCVVTGSLFWIVKVRLVVAPSGIEAAPNALLMTSGVT